MAKPTHAPVSTLVPALASALSAAREPLRTAVTILTARAGETNLGGVPTWASRLAAQFRASSHPWRLHTVVMAVEPGATMPAALASEPGAVLVPFPASGHVLDLLEATRKAVRARGPSVVLPSNTDLCQMVAQQIRDVSLQTTRPVRIISAARTDEPANFTLLQRYQPADGGVGVSAPCAAWLGNLLANRVPDRTLPVALIPSGAHVAAQPRRVSPDGPLRIAWVGRLEQAQKRVMDLPVLAAALRDLGVEFELHIAGDGEMREPLATALAIGQLSAEQGGPVHVHGPLSPEQVHELLLACDVLTLTSAAEGTSVAMQEAMGLGLVPAVTQIAGITHWITHDHNGIFAPVGKPATLARHIARLAADRQLLAAMAECAWRTATQEFSAQATAARYAGLFDAVMAQPVARTTSNLLGLKRLSAAAAPSEPTERTAHWPRCTFEDGRAALKLCRQWASQAGAILAADPESALPGQCIVFDPRRLPPLAKTVAELQARGVLVVVPHALLNHRPCDRARLVLCELVAAGHKRIAFYAAGAHTRALCAGLPVIAPGDFGIVGIIDDSAPRAGALLGGLPVIHPDSAESELAPDAIVVSSDRHEPELLRAGSRFAALGITVVPIYDRSLTSIVAAERRPEQTRL